MSGYWYPMLASPKDRHRFKPGSTFDNAFNLYCFDKDLRHLIAAELEKIEVAVRAKMSYVLSHAHGPFWFSKREIFKKQEVPDPLPENWKSKFDSSLEKLTEEYNRSKEEFIIAFKKKYSDPLPPCWTLLEVSSFGNLSAIYSNLIADPNKKAIARYFGLEHSTFSSWLHCLTFVRNVCAHHSRLWNKTLDVTPRHPKTPGNTFIPPLMGDEQIQNKPAYYLLAMIVYLLNIVNPKHNFRNRLYRLFTDYPMVDLSAMGFPENWQKEKLWEWDRIKKEEGFINRLSRSALRLFTYKTNRRL